MPIQTTGNDFSGGFLQNLAATQQLKSGQLANESAQISNANNTELLTLNRLRAKQAQREDELAASLFAKQKETAQIQEQAKQEKAVEDYVQSQLDLSRDPNEVMNDSALGGRLAGTAWKKIPAPWDTSGNTMVWSFTNPAHPETSVPQIFNEDAMRARYKENVTGTAGADADLLKNGMRRKPDGTIEEIPGWVNRDAERVAAGKSNNDMTGLPDLAKLQLWREKLVAGGVAENSPLVKEVDKEISQMSENAFDKAAGEGSVKDITAKQASAQSAVQLLQSNKEALNMLNSGIITGTNAEVRLAFGKFLNTTGMWFNDNAADNTQAYAAAAAQRVAQVIKAFGAGTGLSDADREYAKQASAADFNMTESALRKLIDINNRAARYDITSYQDTLKTLDEDHKKAFGRDMSLKVDPELMTFKAEKAAPKKVAQQSGFPVVVTARDYAKIRPGQTYMDKDGNKRIKGNR